MTIYAVRANLTICEVEADASSGGSVVELNGEDFILLMQPNGFLSQFVSENSIVRLQRGDSLLGFVSEEDAKEFIRAQAKPMGNLKEVIAATLTKELRDKYIVFGAITGWIHEFKIEPMESDTRSQRIIVYICLDDLNCPSSSWSGMGRSEHHNHCRGSVRGYPYVHDPLSTFERLERFEVFDTKAAYMASLTIAYIDRVKQKT